MIEPYCDLATVLEEEWIKIPLATAKDLHLSLPRFIDGVLDAKVALLICLSVYLSIFIIIIILIPRQ